MVQLFIEAKDWERIFKPGAVVQDEEDLARQRQIHITDVQRFLSCRRSWEYSSPLRMGYEPLLPNMNLWLGRMVHDALAFWYSTSDPRKTLEYYDDVCEAEVTSMLEQDAPGKFVELMQDTRDLGFAMLRHYILYSRRHDKDFRVLATEVHLAAVLPFVPNTVLTARLDLVAELNGDILIIDHKTASRIPNEVDVQLDSQPTAYMFAASTQPEYEGRRIKFWFNYLWKKEPMIPRVLQSGRLSKAKLNMTTLEMYVRAIREVGHDIDSYPDVLLELKHQENKFFRRHEVFRSPKALQLYASDLSSIAADMLAPVPATYPSFDRFRCAWCDFREPCQLQSNGADPKPLLQANYRRRDVQWR